MDTSEIMATLRSCFEEFDDGRKGYLDRSDIKAAMTALLGTRPSKFEVDKLLTQTAGGQMNLHHFTKCLGPKLAALDEDDFVQQMFYAFDARARGFITIVDLFEIFASIAPSIPPRTIEEVFSEADANGDGRIGFAEFERMVKQHHTLLLNTR
jgi:Ca2+-binding EF-hand superfamily protein